METKKLFPGKAFISSILEMLEYKAEFSGLMKRRYLMRAAMAGVIVGLFYVTNYTIQAGFDAISLGPAGGGMIELGKLVGALTFGFALVFIYFSKSELLTSNMMITSVGQYYRAISARGTARLLSLCFFGNFLGGLFVAVLMALSSIISPAVMDLMVHSVDHKLAFITDGASGWLDLLVRAMLCNFAINLAMLMAYNGFVKEDLMKAVGMLVAVFMFGYLGFEHSVANTVLFTMVGVQEGLSLGPAALNVIICLMGNWIGGGLLIGLYYAYLNDEARYVRQNPDLGKGTKGAS